MLHIWLIMKYSRIARLGLSLLRLQRHELQWRYSQRDPIMSREENASVAYLFAASSEAFDHGAREYDRKWLLGTRVWAGEVISRTIWPHLWIMLSGGVSSLERALRCRLRRSLWDERSLRRSAMSKLSARQTSPGQTSNDAL